MAVGGKFFFSFFPSPPHRRSAMNHTRNKGKEIHVKLAGTLYMK